MSLCVGARRVRDFTMYVHDDRYSVPTLVMVAALNEARAKEFAQNKLDESPHHRAVEVTDDEWTLFRLERHA